MGGQKKDAAQGPAMIGATLFLERLSPIDYNALIHQVGGTLGINAADVGPQEPNSPIVLPVDGDVVFGLPMDFPYPEMLRQQAQFAYWWPNALSDLARHKAHMMIHCEWSKHSRLDAHKRHLVLVRELVEQLPVIGVLWGSSLVPAEIFRDEATRALKGGIPFSLWVLIQFSRQPNGNILISTLGMRDFEMMEIETESSLPLDQTFDLVRQFGSHVLAHGVAVKDGETFALPELPPIKVRHARSFRPDLSEPVCRIEFTEQPAARKPKGFFSSLFGSASKQ